MKEFRKIAKDDLDAFAAALELTGKETILKVVEDLDKKGKLSDQNAKDYFKKYCAKVSPTKMPFTLLQTSRGMGFILGTNLVDKIKKGKKLIAQKHSDKQGYLDACDEILAFINGAKGYAYGFVKSARDAKGSLLKEGQFEVLEILQSGFKASGTLKKTSIDRNINRLKDVPLKPKSGEAVIPRWETAADEANLVDFNRAYRYLANIFESSLANLVASVKANGALTSDEVVQYKNLFEEQDFAKEKIKESIQICETAFVKMKDMDTRTEEKEDNVELWEKAMIALFKSSKTEEKKVQQNAGALDALIELSDDIEARMRALKEMINQQSGEGVEEAYIELLDLVKYYKRQHLLHTKFAPDVAADSVMPPDFYIEEMRTLKNRIKGGLDERYNSFKEEVVKAFNVGDWADGSFLEALKLQYGQLTKIIKLEGQRGIADDQKTNMQRLLHTTIQDVSKAVNRMKKIEAFKTNCELNLMTLKKQFDQIQAQKAFEFDVRKTKRVLGNIEEVKKGFNRLDNEYGVLQKSISEMQSRFEVAFNS